MNVQQLNQDPLENLCESLLKKANHQPDPDYLYSLQLAQYLLENYDLRGPWAKRQLDLLEQVKMMFGFENQEKIQKWLHGDHTLQSLLPNQKNLQQLGTFLVENLYQSLPCNIPRL